MQMSTKDHVEKAMASGVPLAAYARQHGLKPASLYKARQVTGARKAAPSKAAGFLRVATSVVQKVSVGRQCELSLAQTDSGLWALNVTGIPVDCVGSLVSAVTAALEAMA